jgi:hypothetical protein
VRFKSDQVCLDNMNQANSAPKTGLEKLIAFFNEELDVNHPVAISEVVERTGLSWSFIKKTLVKINTEYEGFHFEKSGGTWLCWKDRTHVIKKLNDTCAKYLTDEERDEEC